MIELNQISVGYDREILRLDQMNLSSGELIVCIGRNGIGKSTFLRSLSGEQALVSGSVLIDGTNILSLSVSRRARLVSFVDTRFDGVANLRVIDYVALGRIPYTNFLGSLSTDDLFQSKDILLSLGLEQLSDKFTQDLSDGEKQLVSIARALNQDTPVVLLDEPTSFLDYSNRHKILRLLKKVARDFKKCIILSSHDVELSLDYADTFLLFQNSDRSVLKLVNLNISKEQIIEICFPDIIV